MEFLASLPPINNQAGSAWGAPVNFGAVDFGPSAAQQATQPTTLLIAGAALIALVLIVKR
ncbi:MAG: hypothetical protein LC725_08120 [Lentisphaerae bacterium]|nr:hypothetical protein [Lentisphaerota bacterium]